MVPNLRFFIFSQNFVLGEFEGADFKYDDIILWIPAQKYPNKALLVPNLGFFVFLCKILLLDKMEGADFNYDNSFLNF